MKFAFKSCYLRGFNLQNDLKLRKPAKKRVMSTCPSRSLNQLQEPVMERAIERSFLRGLSSRNELKLRKQR
jgi:hypothetical protein